MRDNVEELASQLVDEHGLPEAYKVALIDTVAAHLGNKYELSVKREVKALLRNRVDDQVYLLRRNDHSRSSHLSRS